MTNVKQRIIVALLKRFPKKDVAPDHFGELLDEYAHSGLSPPHLAAEIETADEGKLWSYIWEAMLYRHLRSLGYMPRNFADASGQHGPDFGIDHQGTTIWIEAIVPEPKGIPAQWLEPPHTGEEAKTMPTEQMLLRCTSVINDKQKKFAEYQANGIIGPKDCTVIAVNVCRLAAWDHEGFGISLLPLAVEAVFSIGPLAAPIKSEGKLGPLEHMPRFAIKKANGAEVHTDYFLNPLFANISAVMQAHQKDMYEKDLILSTVHNPLATNPLPTGLFHECKEFVTEELGEEYQLRDIARPPTGKA